MIALLTNNNELFHEGEEMLRLFFGMEEIRSSSLDGAEYVFSISAVKSGAIWYSEASAISNDITITHSERTSTELVGTIDDDIVGDKRIRNMSVKLALFDVLKALFPEKELPWGALTGIRPTKLLYDLMNGGMSALEAAQYMNRVYCVDENKTDILLDIEYMQRGLRGREPAHLADVYIGIPFCPSRCVYCSFVSSDIKSSGHLRVPYTDALLREIKQTRKLMSDRSLRAATVYIGGGTPTTLELPELENVLAAASAFCPESGEFTLEAGRPDTITRDKLLLAKEYGVTRISVNPQSMNDATLIKIGRRHSVDDIIRAYELVREIGFNSVNMDIIAGLTDETVEMFTSSLSKVIALRPENVTVHTLSIKRSSALHEQMESHAIASGDSVGRMVDLSRCELAKAGYMPYYLYRQKYMTGNLENVGYTLPISQCHYNIDVMEETHTNIAMGAGAITKWLYPDIMLIRRAANVKNIEQYIDRVDEMSERKRLLSESENGSENDL